MSRHGMTIIELLVVIVIVGVLLALLIPALQRTRCSARESQCQTRLRWLGIAAQAHLSQHGHFPTDGWGYQWTGDPDGGFGDDQPGGWIYNLLPFMERQQLRELGVGANPERKKQVMTEVNQTPIELLHCPGRRTAQLYPYTSKVIYHNANRLLTAGKTDYAVNAGDVYVGGGAGPQAAEASQVRGYEWPDTERITGISFVRSRVRDSDVADGLGTTYLIGEKHVPAEHYKTGQAFGDNQSLFIGDDADIRRWTYMPPRADALGGDNRKSFGSAHANVVYFCFCDGSVRPVGYDIDKKVHAQLGNRGDGAGSGNF